MTSLNGKYVLRLYNNGNLALFGTSLAKFEKKDSEKRIVWESDTIRRGNRLIMQNDGNLIFYGIQNEVIFQSNTTSEGEYFTIENDGNLAVYNSKDKKIWELIKSEGRLV